MVAKRFLAAMPWLLGFALLLAACQPGPAQTQPGATETAPPLPPTDTVAPPTSTPTINFSISKDASKVFFGAGNPLSELAGSQAEPFPEGYQVNTDQAGIAVLRGSASAGACTIYVFRTTTLNKTACQPGTYAGSNVSCIEEGSALYNQCSNHIVITPSGVAEHKATTLSVTYLPERQISLFIALDGEVEVRPLRNLDDYDLAVAPVLLRAGEFIYTAPDEHVETLSEVPMRVALPLERLAPLVIDLDLQVWMEQTQSGLDKQDLPYTLLPVLSDPIGLTVTVAGPPFDRSSALVALALAAPWAEYTDALVEPAGIDLTAETLDPGETLNLRDGQYDPNYAREILAGMDYPDGLSTMIVYPEGNEMLAALAERLASALPKGGITADIEAVPADQIEETVRFRQEVGIPVIWLRLEYPVLGY